MTSKDSGSKPTRRSTPTSERVEAFLDTLDHPSKQEIIILRQIILAADPTIGEGIKWKVPSFHTVEYFATMNLRVKSGIGVILHFGAKKGAFTTTGVAIKDPDSLLVWLAKDRATVTFRDVDDLAARRATFTNLIRQWIKYL